MCQIGGSLSLRLAYAFTVDTETKKIPLFERSDTFLQVYELLSLTRVVMSKNPIARVFGFWVGFGTQKPKVGFCYFAFFFSIYHSLIVFSCPI